MDKESIKGQAFGEALSDDMLSEIAGGRTYTDSDLRRKGYDKTKPQHVIDGGNKGLTFRDRHGNRTGYFCGNHVTIWVNPSDTYKLSEDPVTGKYNVTFIKAYRNGNEGYVNRYYVEL